MTEDEVRDYLIERGYFTQGEWNLLTNQQRKQMATSLSWFLSITPEEMQKVIAPFTELANTLTTVIGQVAEAIDDAFGDLKAPPPTS